MLLHQGYSWVKWHFLKCRCMTVTTVLTAHTVWCLDSCWGIGTSTHCCFCTMRRVSVNTMKKAQCLCSSMKIVLASWIRGTRRDVPRPHFKDYCSETLLQIQIFEWNLNLKCFILTKYVCFEVEQLPVFYDIFKDFQNKILGWNSMVSILQVTFVFCLLFAKVNSNSYREVEKSNFIHFAVWK